ncbi:hypothetical protein [Maribacter aestuarii]|uniref:hypothetical protein n=1 Tax=Maribacter aestuarii TaxID=1130723 RepID=UPI00248BCA94|nr:hypothetical protein [Maribacter aestuarii]
MLKKSFSLFLLNAMLVLFSCKGQKNAASEDVKNFPDMELIMEENYSGSEVEETLIIKDQKSLTAFLEKLIELENLVYRFQRSTLIKK